MAEILPPNMAAFLQQAMSPERQRELTLAAAMRAGLLNPDAGTGPIGTPPPGPMPPTLSGVENRPPAAMPSFDLPPSPAGPAPLRTEPVPATPGQMMAFEMTGLP